MPTKNPSPKHSKSGAAPAAAPRKANGKGAAATPPERGPERGLGRGLAVLLGAERWQEGGADGGFSETALASLSARERLLPIEFLHPNPNQPRREFPQGELRALADSIERKGMLQPILARPRGEGRFEIVAGERRWRAAQMRSIHQVPVVVRELSDAEALECALIENIQRSNLNPMEESRGYKRLMDECNYTQEKLARALSKSRSHVANMLRLQQLPPEVQEMVSRRQISAGHARALVGRKNALFIAQAVLRDGLNVRQTEALATDISGLSLEGNANGRDANRPDRESKPADILRLEERITAKLGMQVSIHHHGSAEGGRGKVVVTYASLEQFEYLCARLAQPTPEQKDGSRVHWKSPPSDTI